MNKQLTRFLNMFKPNYQWIDRNIQLKTIILKETKAVLKDKNYVLTIIFSVLFFLGLSYVFSYPNEPEALRKLFMEVMFTLLPSFAIWMISTSLIQEKFNDEKLVKTFEAMLTAPISLTTIWVGKILSIFLLNYTMVIFGIASLCVIWDMSGLNPFSVLSAEVWLMALFIAPLYVMAYVAFSSWTVLRFKHPKLLGILSILSIGILTLILTNSENTVKSMPIEHVVTWSTLFYSVLGLIVAFIVIYVLINRLDKEKVTI